MERTDLTRRRFVGRLAGAALATVVPPGLAACESDLPPRPRATGPNLVLIMADDLGFADTSLYGRTDYATPVLDQLAREGVRLTDAYSSAPVCSPTRVALMTGRYPARYHVGLLEPITTQATGLPTDPPTLPRLLHGAGYETALVGKWHLGTPDAYQPHRHGFDEFFGFRGPADDYVSHIGTESLEHDLWDGTRPVRMDGYLTELFTERAVAFIRRPRDTAFFLSLQYNAPHWPWQAPGDPPWPDSLRWRRGGSQETFAQMVRSLDDGVDRVLEAIRSAGIENDTLVIFTSDNGGEVFSDMGPFANGKMTLWEGGIRVAAFARWPAVIPAGTVTGQACATMDWTATLLAAAGVAPDQRAPLDGIDLMPMLTGGPVVSRELYWRTFQRTRHKALRSGVWKYLVTEDGARLFDLAADPGESIDLAPARPDVLARLETAYTGWELEMLEPVPLDPRYA
ncbi:MAG: sulfatase-like hydrolase/transferase [Gemmatimonadetes bacterium]|nr:sulfatase-like hydrolase/transferase [Gemmatimonadota bacterium]